MNIWQRILLWLGSIIITIVLITPPWYATTAGNVRVWEGYSRVKPNQANTAVVDVPLHAVNLLGVTTIITLIVISAGKTKKKDNIDQ